MFRMKRKTSSVGRLLGMAICLCMAMPTSLYAQDMPEASGVSEASVMPKVEIFAGADLHYRDIFFGKIYEVLVNLTPGIKWNMGHQWMLAGQAMVPVYNDYGDRMYNRLWWK